MSPLPFSRKEALRTGWNLALQNMGVAAPVVGIGWLLSMLEYGIRGSSDRNPGLAALLVIVLQVAETAVILGGLHLALRVLDGKPVSLRQLFDPSPQFFNYLIAGALYALIVAGGLLLLVVPGIIWAVRYGAFAYLAADRKLDPMDALRTSAQLTRGHGWQLFTFGLLLIGMNILGAITFGIGLFVTVPTTALAAGIGYRSLLAAVEHRETPATPPLDVAAPST